MISCYKISEIYAIFTILISDGWETFWSITCLRIEATSRERFRDKPYSEMGTSSGSYPSSQPDTGGCFLGIRSRAFCLHFQPCLLPRIERVIDNPKLRQCVISLG